MRASQEGATDLAGGGAAQALPTAHSSADGQWPGIHRQRLAGVECRERLQYGLHPTRFTMGEPIRGIVQQAVQG